MDPCVSAYAVSTIAATPTVVWKSLAICGNNESVTRTCAWLAKPAAASRMMERTGVWRAEGEDVGRADDTSKFVRKRSPGGDGSVDTPRDASFLARETAEAIER